MNKNISEKDTIKIKKIVAKIQTEIQKLDAILDSNGAAHEKENEVDTRNASEFLEGIFDGRFMKATNKEEYLLPENYASKSKLVAGDKLKLVFAPDGKYIFKQIEAVPRIRKIGILSKTGQNYKVEVDGKHYNVLKASVTYYKLRSGSKVAVVLPHDLDTSWATIENKIT